MCLCESHYSLRLLYCILNIKNSSWQQWCDKCTILLRPLCSMYCRGSCLATVVLYTFHSQPLTHCHMTTAKTKGHSTVEEYWLAGVGGWCQPLHVCGWVVLCCPAIGPKLGGNLALDTDSVMHRIGVPLRFYHLFHCTTSLPSPQVCWWSDCGGVTRHTLDHSSILASTTGRLQSEYAVVLVTTTHYITL